MAPTLALLLTATIALSTLGCGSGTDDPAATPATAAPSGTTGSSPDDGPCPSLSEIAPVIDPILDDGAGPLEAVATLTETSCDYLGPPPSDDGTFRVTIRVAADEAAGARLFADFRERAVGEVVEVDGLGDDAFAETEFPTLFVLDGAVVLRFAADARTDPLAAYVEVAPLFLDEGLYDAVGFPV